MARVTKHTSLCCCHRMHGVILVSNPGPHPCHCCYCISRPPPACCGLTVCAGHYCVLCAAVSVLLTVSTTSSVGSAPASGAPPASHYCPALPGTTHLAPPPHLIVLPPSHLMAHTLTHLTLHPLTHLTALPSPFLTLHLLPPSLQNHIELFRHLKVPQMLKLTCLTI